MLVLPSGSQSVDLNRTYTGLTRHRASVQLVLSEDHERDLVRRQIGDRTPVTPSEAMERTARNLATFRRKSSTWMLAMRVARGAKNCTTALT
jgi:ATP-dependent exoDNAse (exonuclease V) alpha subunit